MSEQQFDLFMQSPEEAFAEWKEKPGAKHVLRDLYALAAGYVRDWKRFKIPVSVKLLCEIERQRIKTRRARYRRWYKGPLPTSMGYTLNNTLTASIARHIIAHKPEWEGLFETRETKGEQSK